MYDENRFLNKNHVINRYQLSKLHTFESVARHLSFALAAEELCISPSAVSHQINKLEDELSFKLFQRYHRRIALTHEGMNLFKVVKKSLNILNQEILEIKNQEAFGTLTIFSRPSFAQNWLIPKLSLFARHYPYISLNIVSGNEIINFNRHRVDLAIYYDDEVYDDLISEHLLNETIIPVCSPYYAQQNDLYNKIENLSKCFILHDTQAWGYDSSFDEWESWSKHFSLPYDFSEMQNICFDRSDLAAIAAINHAGIAMGRKQIVKNYLESGLLVTPFEGMEVECSQHYYICTPKERYNPKVDLFIKWLKSYM